MVSSRVRRWGRPWFVERAHPTAVPARSSLVGFLAVDAQARAAGREERREGDVRAARPGCSCRVTGTSWWCRPRAGRAGRPCCRRAGRRRRCRRRTASGCRCGGCCRRRSRRRGRRGPGGRCPAEPVEPGSVPCCLLPLLRAGGCGSSDWSGATSSSMASKTELTSLAHVAELDGQPVAQLRPRRRGGTGRRRRGPGWGRGSRVALVRLVQQAVALRGVVPHAGEGAADLAEGLVVEVAAPGRAPSAGGPRSAGWRPGRGRARRGRRRRRPCRA